MCIRDSVTILASSCLLAFFAAGGCAEMTSTDRLQLLEAGVVAAEEKLTAAESEISFLRGRLEATQAAFADPALTPSLRDQARSTIDQVAEALTQAEQVRDLTAAVLAESQRAVDQAKLHPSPAAELDVITAIVQAVAGRLGPQGAAWGTILALVLSILGHLLQRRTLATAKGALGAIVQGVEAAPTKSADEVKTEIAQAMMKAKIYDKANALVDELKAS